MPATVVVAGTVLAGRIVTTTYSGDVPPVRLATLHRRYVAGSGAGAALGASGAGVAARLVSVVGDDLQGRECVRRLGDAGVEVGGVDVRAGWRTGTSFAAIEPDDVAGDADDDGGAAEALTRVITLPRPEGAAQAPTTNGTGGVTAVRACRPGDALILDPLSFDRDLLAAAYEGDLQVVANLAPFPRLGSGGWPDLADLGAVDVAVVDEAGAGLLAESGAVVGSVVVLLGPPGAPGAGGATWDGQVASHRPGRSVAAPRAGVDRVEFARDVFCGRLAAALASGDDRPEALDAALDAWWAVSSRGAATVFPGRSLDPPFAVDASVAAAGDETAASVPNDTAGPGVGLEESVGRQGTDGSQEGWFGA